MRNLTRKNILLYAAHAYDNPQCLSADEFYDDYARFKYIKRICKRYVDIGDVSERLLLNHLILLINVFGIEATCRILFTTCQHDMAMLQVLCPVLSYLDALPEIIKGINGKDIIASRIVHDKGIVERMQQITE